MANTIQHKRSSTASAVPTGASLTLGELAVNTNDGRLFLKKGDGTVVAIGRDASELNTGTVATARLPTIGNITNAGAIGSTANLPVITTTSGVLTAGAFGTGANQFCQGNDSRLSDTRTPTDGTVTTAKIVNSNVTYAKIQNVSAADRLLGRSTAGAGVVEEITCTADARAILAAANVYAARAWVCFDGTASSNLSGTYSQSGTTVTVTATAHGLVVGQQVYADITSGTGVDGLYTVATVPNANSFTYTAGTSLTTSGNVTLARNTIRGSANVSSVADSGVGVYRVNFTTAMADNHYAALVTANSDIAAVTLAYEDGTLNTRSTQGLTIAVVNNAFTLVDRSRVSVAVFR